tara:strand:+ start:5724 stop:6302 length:579 start_codon:yes stop_codon:yes gene_type:complete
MYASNLRRGFTLIEVLVVISIIGILTAVLYLNFSEARNESRNKVVQSELKEMQLALEVYKAQFGRYPSAPASCDTVSGATTTASSASCGTVPYIAGISPDFIAGVPAENTSGNSACTFIYSVESTDGDWYKLTARNCHYAASSTAGVTQNNELARCPSSCTTCAGSTFNAGYVGSAPFYESYAVYSIGGQCE